MLPLHFNLRIVKPGERYGLNDCLVNDSDSNDALVEFYDARYLHTPHGQFVSRYCAATFLDVKGGLCLQGGIPAWSLTAEQVRAAQNTVREYLQA
jgi:hypothetical protein